MSTTNILKDRAAAVARRNRLRALTDVFVRYGVYIGGIGVLIAITLIFFYLFYVVFPLFAPAKLKLVDSYAIPHIESGETRQFFIEERGEVGTRITDQGKAVFFPTGIKSEQGTLILCGSASDCVLDIALPANTKITSFAVGKPGTTYSIFGLEDGTAVISKIEYETKFLADQTRQVISKVTYPLGNTPLEVDEEGKPLKQVAFSLGEEGDSAIIVGVTEAAKLHMAIYSKEDNPMAELLGEVSYELEDNKSFALESIPDYILLDQTLSNLYLGYKNSAEVAYYDIRNFNHIELKETVKVLEDKAKISSMRFLLGTNSLLIGDSRGKISQWFLVRDKENNYHLNKVRDFKLKGEKILEVHSEQRRRGFLATDIAGNLGVYHSTAQRTLLRKALLPEEAIENIALSPRADLLLVEGPNQLYAYHVHNEHPEISFHSLWGKVWYEGYDKPTNDQDYTWQSTAANDDAEPKFSLMPLTFGTLKAAFYAMLFAIPLAVAAAMYTAYFMSPDLRRFVKPTIEIMEALPTIILGFLAGLWLAPLVEKNLPGVVSMLFLLPFSVLLTAFLWNALTSRGIKERFQGWEAALLMPIVILAGWLAMQLSYPLESLLFGGDVKLWLDNKGIDFDQRNALIVGIAMGFAVIPTIFTIAEDAVFGVPKHLTLGSLALGATPWQTMVRVVLPTASPGIFSALMMGLGRAVGETMIVLMAAGNTAVMDGNIFQGMRTLSANIAVEMPEAEVDSTHYRILFLSGLVLFLFTFIINTLAELVRQHLRKKYSSL